MSRRLPSCIGGRELKTWVSPYPSHIAKKNLPNFPCGNLCKLHRSLKSRWRRASTATTTRIGSLPVYPNSSDPGYAGRRTSSKSQMGRSLWLEQEWRLRISCTRCITGSCSRSRLKKSRAHRCIRRCIRVPCQNEHWLCQCCRLFSCVQHRLATPPSILLQNIPKMPKSLPDWPLNSPAKSGLSFPSFLSNASNVGYLRSRRPACYHHLVPIIIFLWQLVQL